MKTILVTIHPKLQYTHKPKLIEAAGSAGLGMTEACGTDADELKLMPDNFKIGIFG